jgi:hypothetical protein
LVLVVDVVEPDFFESDFFGSFFFESDFDPDVESGADVDFESDDEESDDEESDFEVLSDELPESLDAGDDADFLPRLSVLKKPDPLNVTPTGVKTFLTGKISPESGWATSVRFSSWNPCWISIVSPVSTNL